MELFIVSATLKKLYLQHLGDIGNIKAGPNGRATFRITDRRIKVWDVIGRSFVVHAEKDDLGKGNSEGSHVDGNSGRGYAKKC